MSMKQTMCEFVHGVNCKEVAEFIGAIVRCRDCTNFETDELGDYCTLLDFEDVNGMADKFCAWGERREE